MGRHARRWREGEVEVATFPRWVDGRQGRPVLPRVSTLLNLVRIVQDHASSDDEVVAVITHLLHNGRVTLCGIFANRSIRAGEDGRAGSATRLD